MNAARLDLTLKGAAQSVNCENHKKMRFSKVTETLFPYLNMPLLFDMLTLVTPLACDAHTNA